MIIDLDLRSLVYEDGLMRVSCDTLEEVKQIKEKLGDRYMATWKCEYPDVTFYIIGYLPGEPITI